MISGVGFFGTLPAQAQLLYDQNVAPEVIFGSGNANGAFTVDRQNGVELGLRGKLRFNAANNPENTFNGNSDGTYSFAAGTPPTGFGFASNSPTTPIWNFEWSINSDYEGTTDQKLDDYFYRLDIDFDPGVGTNFLSFDPINLPVADHALGNNSTGNGGGISDPTNYTALIGSNNVAQNSWNMEFFNNAPFDDFDPDLDGTYDFVLTALNDQGSVAQTRMQIIVGTGASEAVPEPASILGLAIGAVAAGGVFRKKQTA